MRNKKTEHDIVRMIEKKMNTSTRTIIGGIGAIVLGGAIATTAEIGAWVDGTHTYDLESPSMQETYLKRQPQPGEVSGHNIGLACMAFGLGGVLGGYGLLRSQGKIYDKITNYFEHE